MKTRLYSHSKSLFTCISFLLLLLLLLAACGSSSTSGKTTASTPEKAATPPTITTPTTVPKPITQTSCPVPGTARAAVMIPLVLGNHANVVYVYNQGPEADPSAGMLKRHDTITGSETVIVTVPHTGIYDAQVSADGQWVLFSTQVSGRSAIQLIRMDGQELQTLYCSTNGDRDKLGALQWSPDQKYLAFREGMDVSLLNVTTGAYRIEVPAKDQRGYTPRTWLDNTRLYMTPYTASETFPLQVYLLDIRKATVKQILSSQVLCGDFDSSLDGTQLFTSECQAGMGFARGPSLIKVQPATGGPTRTIYSNPAYAITALRVVSNNTLLLVFQSYSPTGNLESRNGLWKLNTDGTGLTRLTNAEPNGGTRFNMFTRYFWTSVSRDGQMYAVKIFKGSPRSYALVIGSMNGGALMTLGTFNSDTGPTAEFVGWTTW